MRRATVTEGATGSDRARQPSIPARLARALVHAAERAGADASHLLATCAIDPALLDDEDGRIDRDRVDDLIEAAVGQSGDELLGLHAAQHRALADFGSLAFLLTTSGTLGGAIDECAAFQRLMGESFSVTRAADHVTLRYHRDGPPRPARRHIVEMTAYDWAVNLALLLQEEVRARRVRLAHDVPRPVAAALIDAFGCPVELGAGVDEVVFPPEIMTWPLPGAHADIHAFFLRRARAQLASLPDGSLLARTRRAIEANLTAPPSLTYLAAEVGIGPRTLQRRLLERGYTVRSLVDDVRRVRTIELLETDLSIAAISGQLGYSEPAAFHRAFKRWTGVTPDAFRAARRTG